MQHSNPSEAPEQAGESCSHVGDRGMGNAPPARRGDPGKRDRRAGLPQNEVAFLPALHQLLKISEL